MTTKNNTSIVRQIVGVVIGVILGLVANLAVFIYMSLGGLAAQSNAEAKHMAINAVGTGLILGLLITGTTTKYIAKNCRDPIIIACLIVVAIAIISVFSIAMSD